MSFKMCLFSNFTDSMREITTFSMYMESLDKKRSVSTPGIIFCRALECSVSLFCSSNFSFHSLQNEDCTLPSLSISSGKKSNNILVSMIKSTISTSMINNITNRHGIHKAKKNCNRGVNYLINV